MKAATRAALITLLLAFAFLSNLQIAAGCTPGVNCIVSGATPPTNAPAFGEAHSALSSGLFNYTKTDLRVGGVLPLELTRVYRSEDRLVGSGYIQRDFGLGVSFSYGLYLYSSAEVNNQANPYANISVVMPDGAQLNCICSVSGECNGTQLPTQAPLICGTTQPGGIWSGATLSYVSGSPATWNLVRKDAAVYTFGRGAPLQRITDRYGNYIAISRSNGQTGSLTEISSSSGRSIILNPGSNGSVATATSAGRTVNYDYNGNTALTDVYYNGPSQGHTQYVYGGYMGDVTDTILTVNGSSSLNHNYATYGSGSDRRVATLAPNSQIAPNSPGAYTFTYVQQGSQLEVKVELPDTSIEWFFFDANGYLTKMQRAPLSFNEITVFTRNSSERVTELQDADGQNNNLVLRAAAYQYSTNNDVTNGDITNITLTPGPGGTSNASTAYNHQAVTLPNDNNTAFDELQSVTDPLSQTTSYGYDGSGNLTSTTDPTTTRVWHYTYDANGEVATAKDPKGNTTHYYYYPTSGDLQSIVDPLNLTTSYVTDSLGRVTSIANPAGDVTQYTYNSADVFDNLTQVIDPNENVTQYTYDSLGEIASVQDPKVNTPTTYTRPATLNKLTVCDPLNNCTVTNYDASGKKTDSTDRRGVKTTITYDNLRRVSTAVYNSNGVNGIPKRTINFQNYNALDQVSDLQDNLGGAGSGNTITYQFDVWDNVESEATQYTNYSARVAYTYNAGGQRTSMTQTPNGASATKYAYCYDPDDELTSIYQGSTTCGSGTLLTSLNYDLDGNRNPLIEYPPGGSPVTTTYGYDNDSRLTSQSFTAGSNQLGSLGYQFDGDDRLTSETGSLASINLPSAVSSATYTQTNQVATWAGRPSSYDAASNLTVDPSVISPTEPSLTWDERNILSSVSGGPAFSFSQENDAKGRRENDTEPAGTNFYLDDNTAVVASSGPSNGAYSYVTIPGSGEAVGYTVNGAALAPIHDYLGSTIGMVGSSSTLQTQWTYQPFGVPTESGLASNFQFLFGGAQYDPTGYYDDYSPIMAHSLSGGAVPYTGAGASEFGPGTLPPATDLAGRPSNSAMAVRSAGLREQGDCGSSCQEEEGSSNDNGSSGGVNIGQLLDKLGHWLASLFGGGGSAAVTPKFPAHVTEFKEIGIAQGLAVTQQQPQYPEGRIDVAPRSVPLFRAVKEAELNQILESQTFQNPLGNESKYFSTSAQGAASYAKQAYGRWPQEGPYTIVKSSIPEDQITPEMLPSGGTVDAGIPTINVPTETLPELAPPEVLPEAIVPGVPLVVE